MRYFLVTSKFKINTRVLTEVSFYISSEKHPTNKELVSSVECNNPGARNITIIGLYEFLTEYDYINYTK